MTIVKGMDLNDIPLGRTDWPSWKEGCKSGSSSTYRAKLPIVAMDHPAILPLSAGSFLPQFVYHEFRSETGTHHFS